MTIGILLVMLIATNLVVARTTAVSILDPQDLAIDLLFMDSGLAMAVGCVGRSVAKPKHNAGIVSSSCDLYGKELVTIAASE